jgi:hypothetical protein
VFGVAPKGALLRDFQVRRQENDDLRDQLAALATEFSGL